VLCTAAVPLANQRAATSRYGPAARESLGTRLVWPSDDLEGLRVEPSKFHMLDRDPKRSRVAVCYLAISFL